MTFFLLLSLSTVLSAKTVVKEQEIGVKEVKSTFEITKKAEVKATLLKVDFKKIVAFQKERVIAPKGNEKPVDKLAPKVVIDDVVVFLDGGTSLEGMMVYHGATTIIQPSNCLPTYSPG